MFTFVLDMIENSYFVPILICIFTFVCFFLQKSKRHPPKVSAPVCKSKSCVRCTNDDSFVRNAETKFKVSYNETSQLRIAKAFSHPRKVFSVNELRSHAVWSKNDLPASYRRDCDLLEQNADAILQDYVKLMQFRKRVAANKIFSDDWNKLYIFNQGIEEIENSAVCSNTCTLLTRCDNVMKLCVFGYAFFSILQPNSTIDAHTGPTNTRLRFHLPLLVPELSNEDVCEMVVADEIVCWKESSGVFFDDSLLHSVKYTHATSKLNRVVLLVDFWHPDLTQAERLCVMDCFAC